MNHNAEKRHLSSPSELLSKTLLGSSVQILLDLDHTNDGIEMSQRNEYFSHIATCRRKTKYFLDNFSKVEIISQIPFLVLSLQRLHYSLLANRSIPQIGIQFTSTSLCMSKPNVTCWEN